MSDPVADIDAVMLSDEIELIGLLVAQVVLLGVVWVAGSLSGRAGRGWWTWILLSSALLAAVATGLQAVSRGSGAITATEERLAGLRAGPHMSRERADNHIAWVQARRRDSLGLVAATGLGSGLLHLVARRRRPTT